MYTQYPLTLMPMESQIKFQGQQNISGASQQNSVAAFSLTTEADGEFFQNGEKNDSKMNMKWLHTDHQVSRGSEIPD